MTENGHRTFLGRDQIFAFADRPVESIQVPEWGNQWVRIGTWSLAQQWRIADASLDATKRGRMLALMVALSVVDEGGGRVFSDDDIPRLADEKNYRALQRISDAAMKWNGLAADAVDALGKASESTESAGAPSGSPSLSGSR